MLITKDIIREFWLYKIIIVEIKNIVKKRKVEDTLDIEFKLIAPADSKIVGNNRILKTTEPDTNIKLIFNNSIVDNAAIKDSKIVNIAKADFKLNIPASNFNNTILNKDRNAIVDKAVSVIEIEFSSIDIGITIF